MKEATSFSNLVNCPRVTHEVAGEILTRTYWRLFEAPMANEPKNWDAREIVAQIHWAHFAQTDPSEYLENPVQQLDAAPSTELRA
jgi:hypothetical protein